VRVTRLRPSKPGGNFERATAVLAKRRYPGVRADVDGVLAELVAPGAPPIPCPPRVSDVPGVRGHRVLKVRVGSSDMNAGKSGGFRVLLVLCDEERWEWLPFAVYAKKDREDVPRAEILKMLLDELEPAEGDL
jgi:hypothetical protein